MPDEVSKTKVAKWGNGHGIFLSKKTLEAGDLREGTKIKVVKINYHGKSLLALEPIAKPTLAEKYANYNGTPDSYEQPDDLKDWSDNHPAGKEIW